MSGQSHLMGRAFGNAYLLLSLTALFWAGNQVIGRAVAGHVPPVALAFLRWSLAAVLMLPVCWPYLRRDWPAMKAEMPHLVLLTVTGSATFNTLQYIGLNYTTAINSLVLNSAAPILIAIACFGIYGDRLKASQLTGILVSTAGVLIVLTRADVATVTGLSFNRGDVLIIFTMVLWGIYTALLRKRPDAHWTSFAFILYALAGVFNFPFFVWEHWSGWRLQPTLETALAVLYVAIFPSVLAYTFYLRGVELIGGQRAGAMIHLVPLFGTLMSVAFLKEPLQIYHLVGFALILGGVTLAARKA